ncbi:MAG TPA: hypothetical protein V6D30_21695, partial [Leptolyngbyaceae cyanobacterium]
KNQHDNLLSSLRSLLGIQQLNPFHFFGLNIPQPLDQLLINGNSLEKKRVKVGQTLFSPALSDSAR